MAQRKFYTPLKIGLLIVASSYFLFTLHSMFRLSWIGEWEFISGTFGFIVFIEDISAAAGIAFRVIAGAVAFAAVIIYIIKKNISRGLIRAILLGEAAYWLGLLASGLLPIFYTLGFAMWRINGHVSELPVLTSLLLNELPILVASIALPIVLFKLSYELRSQGPAPQAIKWGLIAGTMYVFVIWYSSAAIWVSTIIRQGVSYVVSYPQNMLSFFSASIGMLALVLFTVYYTKKTMGIKDVNKLDLKTIGEIILALGLFSLLNYLSWIFFGSDRIWSNWYAWFLGINPNLWLLSLPCVGLPLLLQPKTSNH